MHKIGRSGSARYYIAISSVEKGHVRIGPTSCCRNGHRLELEQLDFSKILAREPAVALPDLSSRDLLLAFPLAVQRFLDLSPLCFSLTTPTRSSTPSQQLQKDRKPVNAMRSQLDNHGQAHVRRWSHKCSLAWLSSLSDLLQIKLLINC